jgi:hypothetical protein
MRVERRVGGRGNKEAIFHRRDMFSVFSRRECVMCSEEEKKGEEGVVYMPRSFPSLLPQNL